MLGLGLGLRLRLGLGFIFYIYFVSTIGLVVPSLLHSSRA